MSYQLPKDISKHFWTSLKTVYNYISKYPSKVRTKKEFWKTVVHFEDFAKAFQWNVQNYNPASNPIQSQPTKNETSLEVWTLKEENWKVQKEYNISLQKIQDLEKYNNNLEDQVSKYAILLREEKTEKKDLFEKFERLQNQYNEKIEAFSFERMKRLKRYNGILVICVIILVILAGFVLPNVLDFYFWSPT